MIVSLPHSVANARLAQQKISVCLVREIRWEESNLGNVASEGMMQSPGELKVVTRASCFAASQTD